MELARRLPGKTLTMRGWGFVLTGVLAMLGAQVMGRRDLLYVAIFLLTLPLLAVLVVRLLKPKFEVQRSFTPESMPAGSATTITLEVRNNDGGGAGFGVVQLAEQLPARFGDAPRFTFPGRHSTGPGTSRYEYRLRSSRRGMFPIGPVTADFTDPFGLGNARHTLGTADHLVVTPAPVELPASTLTGSRRTDGMSVTRRQANPSDDDVTTREYRTGDPMRRVHWAVTARHGELMVRQEESVTTPQATIIMDQRENSYNSGFLAALGTESFPGAGLRTSDAFEWCVSAAVSAATDLLERGYELRFLDEAAEPALLRSASAPWPEDEEYVGLIGLHNIADGLAALELSPPAARKTSKGLQKPGTGSKKPGNTVLGNAIQRTGTEQRALVFGGRMMDKLAAHKLRGPLIALLGDVSMEEAVRLAPAAEFGSNAFAVLAVERPREKGAVLEALRRAGWHAVAVPPQADVAAVWSFFDSPDSLIALETA